MHATQMIAHDRKQDLEVWARYDSDAEVYELFASEEADDYIGCADTMSECQIIARMWFDDRACN